jgi:hypothetical protein
MAKRNFDFTYELSIDGEPYPAEQAHPFFQRDPFPGGHRYSCVISGRRLGKYFAGRPPGRRGEVTEQEARGLLQGLWDPWAEGGAGVEYFLNSVEEMVALQTWCCGTRRLLYSYTTRRLRTGSRQTSLDPSRPRRPIF